MRIFIMALEPLETRYTGQWYHGLPALIKEAAISKGVDVEVYNIGGEQRSSVTTAGAFLNFTDTNIWKNTQLNTMADNFANGEVSPGDKILFTDAWHTGVIQMKYMSELLDIPVEIHSMWHAGSYDPQDFLGRKVVDKRWSLAFEKSAFYASDFNYYATEFHFNMFRENVLGAYAAASSYENRVVISGQPHNALVEALKPFAGMAKKRQILFPHRVAPEKQPEIFRDLAARMPDVDFVIAQDKKLTKDEYHTLLAESAIVFSANLQETLGISAMEAILVDTIPFLPNRLSYSEMYLDPFLYPSQWTADFASYTVHADAVVKSLYEILDSRDYSYALQEQRMILMQDYLTCWPMLNKLLTK